MNTLSSLIASRLETSVYRVISPHLAQPKVCLLNINYVITCHVNIMQSYLFEYNSIRIGFLCFIDISFRHEIRQSV